MTDMIGLAEESVLREIKRVGIKAANNVIRECLLKVYDKELGDEVIKGGVGGIDEVIHELMHKLVDPSFLLDLGESQWLEPSQQNRSERGGLEQVMDELVIIQMTRPDFKSGPTYEHLRGQITSDKELLDMLERPIHRPEYDAIRKGALRLVKQQFPNLGKEGPKKAWPPAVTEYGENAADAVTDYFISKLPRLSEKVLSEETEKRFKKFVWLLISRLKKLPDRN